MTRPQPSPQNIDRTKYVVKVLVLVSGLTLRSCCFPHAGWCLSMFFRFCENSSNTNIFELLLLFPGSYNNLGTCLSKWQAAALGPRCLISKQMNIVVNEILLHCKALPLHPWHTEQQNRLILFVDVFLLFSTPHSVSTLYFGMTSAFRADLYQNHQSSVKAQRAAAPCVSWSEHFAVSLTQT